jgi:hypothetical protein
VSVGFDDSVPTCIVVGPWWWCKLGLLIGVLSILVAVDLAWRVEESVLMINRVALGGLTSKLADLSEDILIL